MKHLTMEENLQDFRNQRLVSLGGTAECTQVERVKLMCH